MTRTPLTHTTADTPYQETGLLGVLNGLDTSIGDGWVNREGYGLMDDDGVMDASKLDGAALDQLYDRFVTNGDDTINPGLHDQLTNTNNYYDNGYGRGHGE